MQGVGKRNRPDGEAIEGTDTMHLIKKCNIPKGKKITYARFVSEIQLQKAEIHRTRLTAGGNLLDYEGKTSTDTAGMETIKIHINSTISRAKKGARYLCIDIGNMYLNTKLLSPEYMRIHIDLIPEEIREEYNTDEWIRLHGGYRSNLWTVSVWLSSQPRPHQKPSQTRPPSSQMNTGSMETQDKEDNIHSSSR
jgi:hypothetical protein